MTLSSARKTIAAAAMAAGLIVSGANLALAQTTNEQPNRYTDTNRYGDNSGYSNRSTTEYRGGGFDWGWLGLLGLFGLLGRRRVTTHDTGSTFTRRETFEPRPTR